MANILLDRNKMGMSNISNLRGKDAHQALLEDTDRKLEQHRLSDQDELTKADRLGIPLHAADFIYRVLKQNPRIWVEASINYEGEVGLYTVVERIKTYLVGFPFDVLPEFSSLVLDDRRLPTMEGNTPEVRGWRTALLRLLQKRQLTWKQVLDGFGDATGLASTLWQRETQVFRS